MKINIKWTLLMQNRIYPPTFLQVASQLEQILEINMLLMWDVGNLSTISSIKDEEIIMYVSVFVLDADLLNTNTIPYL